MKYILQITILIASAIIAAVLVYSLVFRSNDDFPVVSITTGIIAMLAVFSIGIIAINKNLSNTVKLRTSELEEQKNNLEKTLAEKTDELLKSERLSAIGELSGRLAHDLRNPLSVMKMSVDLLRDTKSDAKISDEKVMKKLDLISKSIDRISHQVDDVLGFVRNSPMRIESVKISTILESSFERLSVPSDVDISIDTNDIEISCDAQKIEAVFTNLIINAIQAMDNVGKIIIRFYNKDDQTIVEFENNGPSIPEKILPRVFDPLFTTKQKGTGLGLASCKNILEQHNATISVSNNPTLFVIIFPRLDA